MSKRVLPNPSWVRHVIIVSDLLDGALRRIDAAGYARGYRVRRINPEPVYSGLASAIKTHERFMDSKLGHIGYRLLETAIQDLKEGRSGGARSLYETADELYALLLLRESYHDVRRALEQRALFKYARLVRNADRVRKPRKSKRTAT
jgi:hypothetical protein